MPAAPTDSSYASRIARQYQQQYGRPASADNPHYAEYVKTALPAMIQADKDALAKSQGRWKIADKVAMGAAAIPFGAAALGAMAGGGAASSALPSSVEAASLGGNATLPAAATAGIGFDAAPAVGAGMGAGAGAGSAASLLGLSAKDWAALVPALTGTIGSALSPKPNMNPTTATSDPNLQQLIQTMQGRLNKSEPLYDSIMAMANGLLPTQYQKGGGGMG